MDGGNIASILAAIVAALSAWAVSRSATKGANKAKEIEAQTTRESARSNAESEAYERARAFDTETIARQATQIQELQRALGERESELGQVRTDNGLLHADIRLVSTDNRELQAELNSCHRVIENLRSYIQHNPDGGGDLPLEIEAPLTTRSEVDPIVRDKVIEAIGEDLDDYVEPGDSYPDQN